MSKAFKSRYKPKNIEKYADKKGLNNIIARSSWERTVMIWLDNNTDVISWASENVIVPYISKVDGKRHRYYIDFYIKFKSGQVYLVEVKPKYQTKAPDIRKKSKKRIIQETTTYATNISKWEAATAFAVINKAKFVIWTEDELAALGMKINASKSFRYAKYAKKTKPRRQINGSKK